MSDTTANDTPRAGDATTITDILRTIEPMGDLSRFGIEDLTPEEEAEFFRILEEA
ncbi:hypothetical protein [Iamia sp.]|uniref:hypothetical protein n=1 Tax=Iamia sp. TaxID=2722710 RepID=UPI002C09FA2A|nr:hypothetical protein [Iamia sp.]HXH55782.1 hypothetical protein [Iamia sp.]